MDNGRPNWFLVLLVALAAPLFGVWAAQARIGSLNAEAQAAAGMDMAAVCQVNQLVQDARVAPLCRRLATADFLNALSIGTLAAGLLLVFGYVGLAWWAGANRNRNAAVFPVAVPVALAVVGLLTLAQVGIVLTALYMFNVLNYLFFLIALAGALAAYAVLMSLRELARKQTHYEYAVRVRPDQAPALWSMVNAVAKKVGAAAPRNLIVGLQPGFYATSAQVALQQNGRTMSGETLYLSIPLLRILKRQEVEAVVGHELGHFKAADVAYTRRFSPAFAGMSAAVSNALHLDYSFIQVVARTPALVFTRFLLSVFATNESRIRRDRELEADRVGAAAGSAEALATALLKISAYSSLWPRLEKLAVAEVQAGIPSPDLAASFETLSRRDSTGLASANIGWLLRQRTSHPLDTHPPTAERLDALGVDATQLDMALDQGWAAGQEVAAELERLGEEVTKMEMVLIEEYLERQWAQA